MQLTLGPILFYWSKEEVQSFYQAAANWPVDVVYLGETVCSRRREMKLHDWLDVAAQLDAAGKEVVLSTQTLLESEADLRQLNRLLDAIAGSGRRWLVEASDLSAVQGCRERGLPFVGGAALNIYNSRTLQVLARQGLKRWCFPVELSRTTLADMQDFIQAQEPQLQTEVFAFGHLPLAWSARCFTARHHDLPKDRCLFICRNHPAGLTLRSQENQQLFTMNGIQTLSGSCSNLLHQLPEMQALGVSHVRLSPVAEGMAEVVAAFDAARQGQQPVRDPLQLLDLDGCNGYWFGLPGMQQQATATT